MRTRSLLSLALTVLLLTAACAADDEGDSSAVEAGAAATTTTGAEPTSTTADDDGADGAVDLTQLPLGDGAVRTDTAEVGSVLSCTDRFGGGGAFVDGPWIEGDTYDLTAKVHVDGEVTFDGELEIERVGDVRRVSGNGLPDHATGSFPVATDDDAYQYDRNPNTIAAQDVLWSLPAEPAVADEPTCVPMGAIGILQTGSVVFNALDALGRDAVAHEVQDACEGHPEMSGQYHYHSLTPCLDEGATATGDAHGALVGYALDGFGIYDPADADGSVLSSADLDECHGHVHDIDWDGQVVEMFHYHATWDYPYTVGCYRGTPVS